jgi:hypothetical protein
MKGDLNRRIRIAMLPSIGKQIGNCLAYTRAIPHSPQIARNSDINGSIGVESANFLNNVFTYIPQMGVMEIDWAIASNGVRTSWPGIARNRFCDSRSILE